MGSISEQDYQDILRESVGAWFRTDEDERFRERRTSGQCYGCSVSRSELASHELRE